MARYLGVELPILIVGLALTVALVFAGGMKYVVLIIVPFGVAAGLYAYRFMKRRETEARR